MERWKQSNKNPDLMSHNDENHDPWESVGPRERQTSAKNMLFQLAETEGDFQEDDKTPVINQWFRDQSISIAKEPRTTPNRFNKPLRKTVHARLFAERHINLQPANQEQSIIPRLKQQLKKLESPSLPNHNLQERRRMEFAKPNLRWKQQLLIFEEMLHSYQHSVRIKNTPAPRKSAKLALSHNYSEGGSRKQLLSRGASSKDLRKQNESLLIRQQARKNRTLNNLLQ